MVGRIFLSVMLLICSVGIAQNVASPHTQVGDAILHLVQDGVPKRGVKPFKGNRVASNVILRDRLARAITSASETWDVPRMLLVAIAFRENSFSEHGRGKLGERSTFQVVPSVARCVRKGLFPWSKISEPKCSLDTIEGAAFCAAALLAINRDRCRCIKGAVVLYASGRTCVPDTKRLRWILRDRLSLASYLEDRF